MTRREALQRLYLLQEKLNQKFYALYPDKPKGVLQVLSAISAEVGEFLNELKPKWAWWKPDGPIGSNALEEGVDILFFALTMDLLKDADLAYLPLPHDAQDLYSILHHALYLAHSNALRHTAYPVAPVVLEALSKVWTLEEILSAYDAKWQENMRRIDAATR